MSPCHYQELTPSTASTEYCIQPVLHHPNTDCLLLSASLSSLGWPCCTQFSTFPQLRVNQWIESQLLWRLPPEQPPPDWPPPGTAPISLDHGLQVHLQIRSITIGVCISMFTLLWPPRESPNSLEYGLQVNTITASNCISTITQSWPRSASLCSLDYYLVKGWSWKADSPSSTLRRTSLGIRWEFVWKSGSG